MEIRVNNEFFEKYKTVKSLKELPQDIQDRMMEMKNEYFGFETEERGYFRRVYKNKNNVQYAFIAHQQFAEYAPGGSHWKLRLQRMDGWKFRHINNGLTKDAKIVWTYKIINKMNNGKSELCIPQFVDNKDAVVAFGKQLKNFLSE